MKGQISLEFLLVVVIFISVFALIIPQINKTKSLSDYALRKANAELILNRVYYGCERALITNSNEQLSFDALGNFNLQDNDSHLVISFEGMNETKHISKQKRFSCITDFEMKKGNNLLNFYVENNQAIVTPNEI